MGLSFHGKTSMVEAAGSLHFAASGHESSILEINQEKRDDVTRIKLNDDINCGKITDEPTYI